MKTQNSYRKGVFIVVYRKHQRKDKPNSINNVEYLILRRRHHWRGWEFPKGGVEQGEALFAAAKRECFEETGIKAINNKIKKFHVSGRYLYNKRFRDRPGFIGQSYVLFSAQVPNNKRVRYSSKEHSYYLWLSFEKAIKKLRFNNQKKCLAVVNHYLTGK